MLSGSNSLAHTISESYQFAFFLFGGILCGNWVASRVNKKSI